jgi:hypothetical protein
MPGENSQDSGETGGLTDGLLLARFGEESAGSARCVCGRVDGLRCVALLRAAWCVVREAYEGRVNSTVRRVAALASGAAAVTNSRRERSC